MTVTIISDTESKKLKTLVPPDVFEKNVTFIGALDENDDIMGLLAISELSGRAWDIPYIYVVKAFRRQGVGRRLFDYISDLARNNGVSDITVSYIDDSKRNPLSGFFQSMQFEEMDSSELYQIPLSLALDALDSNKSLSGHASGLVIPLKLLKSGQWYSVTEKINRLAKNDGSDGFFAVPYPRTHFDDEYSLVILDKDSTPEGLILCTLDDTILNIDYLCSLNPHNPMISAMLIKELCRKASQQTEDLEVHFHAYNPKMSKLGKVLLGDLLDYTGRYVSLICSL